MKLKPSTYFAVAIMIIMALVISNALTFRYFQSALLPILFGGFVFILAGIQVWKEISGKETKKAKEKLKDEGEEIQYKKGISLVVFVAWIAGFAVAILLLGHLIALPLFIFSYIKWRGKRWFIAGIAALGFTALLYVLFPLGFRAQFYDGYIWELIVGG